MVSFICNDCQDTIKKPKIKKHIQLTGHSSFSCIDCGVDFDGRTVHSHSSCITEEEKYVKKPARAGKKGISEWDEEEQEWERMMNRAAEEASDFKVENRVNGQVKIHPPKMKTSIRRTIQKHSGGKIRVRDVKKEVLKHFLESPWAQSVVPNHDEIVARFEEKIQNPMFVIDGQYVSMLASKSERRSAK